MIPNQLYLVTDKTVDELYDLIQTACNALTELNDKDLALQLLFDAQEKMEDLPAIPGIEGVDRIKPAIPAR